MWHLDFFSNFFFSYFFFDFFLLNVKIKQLFSLGYSAYWLPSYESKCCKVPSCCGSFAACDITSVSHSRELISQKVQFCQLCSILSFEMINFVPYTLFLKSYGDFFARGSIFLTLVIQWFTPNYFLIFLVMGMFLVMGCRREVCQSAWL